MRSRLATSLLISLCVTSTAIAVGPDGRDSGTTAMSGAGIAAPLRSTIRVAWNQPARAAAWQRFTSLRGARWQSSWDRATRVPSRIWGEGIAVPGASLHADVAARAARELIEQHLDLLAPGASAGDLELVSNHWDGSMRSVGFVQRHGGMRVVGGQVSVRIKNDRVFVISSQALPHVAAALPNKRAQPAVARDRVRAAMIAEVGIDPARLRVAAASPSAEPMILPLVTNDGVAGYRVVTTLAVDAGAAGAWTAYVDAATGEPIARHQQLHFGIGWLEYDAVTRWPGRGRDTFRVGRGDVTVGGQPFRTGPLGEVFWAGDAPTTIGTSVHGERATVINKDGAGIAATASLAMLPTDTTVWSAVGDEIVDAQINGFVHASLVREFVRTFAPQLPFLWQPVQVVVNIDDQCNAYSNGTAIHFFKSSMDCENTALLADVVYHEYGHSLHYHAIIDGVGAFDSSMSEGLSDFLAAAITDDPGMGRGFFHTDEPLRHLDPDGREHIYPRDVGEVHYTGLIYGGMFWDLRKALIAELGDTAGKAKTLELFYGTVQRATDIPSALIEALATDDDDGNLDNGTPHECTIRTALGAHGLRTASGHVIAPGAVVAGVGQIAAPLEIQITGLSANCTGDEILSVDVEWRPGIGGSPSPGGASAIQNGESWSSEIPLPIDGGRVDYQVVIRFADGTDARLPDNEADTLYQMYQGETVELYCSGFETDPFAEGWTRGGSEGAKGFEWGTPDPSMMETAFDPDVAYAGTSILALGLNKTYSDAPQDGGPLTVWAQLPTIDVGQYSDVHLQFRRWLTVEDGFFDQATIAADGEPVWTNFNSMEGNQSNTHHLDLEWRFQSIPLSSKFAGPDLDLQFSMTSDQGLAFGGWQIDELCVVANPNSICGDGVISLTEECDDGPDNANLPDRCRTFCRFAACGDGIVDTGEACEPELDSTCLPACVYGPDAGCCSTGSAPGGPLVLGGLVIVVLRRRRQRGPRRP